jgi:hypothetical protein
MAAVAGNLAKEYWDDFGIVGPRSQLLKHRISDNAGGVNHSSSILVRALGSARHFTPVEELPYQPRLARNRFQVRNSVRPMHLFGRNFDHDYYFRLPSEGRGFGIRFAC